MVTNRSFPFLREEHETYSEYLYHSQPFSISPFRTTGGGGGGGGGGVIINAKLEGRYRGYLCHAFREGGQPGAPSCNETHVTVLQCRRVRTLNLVLSISLAPLTTSSVLRTMLILRGRPGDEASIPPESLQLLCR